MAKRTPEEKKAADDALKFGRAARPAAPALIAPPAGAPEDNGGDDGDFDSSVAQIEEMLANCGLDNGEVRISRRAPRSVKFDYCGAMPINDFSFEDVKARFGGGDYRLSLHDENGRYIKRKSFSIDHRIKGELDGGEPKAAAAPGPQFDAEAVRQEAETKTGGIFEKMLAMQAQATRDMLAMQQQNTQQLVAVLTASSGKKSEGLDFKDMLQMAQFVMSMKTGGGKEMSLADTIAAFKELRELAAADGGGEAGGGWLDKIAEFLPAILARMQGGIAPGAGAIPVGPAAAAGPAQLPPQRRMQPRQDPAQETNPFANPAMFIKAAKRGDEVELWCDWVMVNIEDDQLALAQNVLTQEDWFALLFAQFPEAENVREWLTKLRDMLLDSLAEELKPEPTDANPNPAGADLPPGVQRADGVDGAEKD